jgi:hypothetical protein
VMRSPAARLDPRALDFLAIYLPGLDIAQHTLLGSGEAVAPSAMAARLQGLRSYYFFLDALLRDIATAGEGELVVVVAEPGRIASITGGAIAASGRGAAAAVQGDARPVDVAPTLLHGLGVPISRELPGRPLLTLLDAQLVKRLPVREVGTYGRRAAPAGLREGQPLDREMIERLRSLGYVR